MNSRLRAICATHTSCKCCGARANLYGLVDFHKNCEIHRRKVLDLSGIPVYYYRCSHCRFIFTTAFDDFTKEEFLQYIYNEEYLLVDPDYREVRPKGNAATLCSLFSTVKPGRILDYGGGDGVLTELLRAAGFPLVETYDPFVPRHSARPLGRFDCIVSFEVVEHTTDPAGVFADMNALLADPGVILFSTLIQPADIDNVGLNWWYAGPRNGHVSLYSKASLAMLVERFGFTFGSFSDGWHVLFREIPDFAQHFLRR